MEKLYFCSYDGNSRAVFKSEKKALNWQEEQGSLAFVNEVSYKDGKIVLVNEQAFSDFVESISDEMETEEFKRVKDNLEKEWAFAEKTDD